MIITMDGFGAKKYASQGQARSIAIALKLAELMSAKARGESPLLLLDDLSSELIEIGLKSWFKYFLNQNLRFGLPPLSPVIWAQSQAQIFVDSSQKMDKLEKLENLIQKLRSLSVKIKRNSRQIDADGYYIFVKNG